MTSVVEFLDTIASDTKSEFRKSHSVLSFEQYLEIVKNNPSGHLRNCAQFFADMVDSYGESEVQSPGRKLRRFNLFDAQFADGEGKIFGQELVQQEIISHLKNFARSGRVDKLLLLHGPNGSAKTSIVQALCRAAEMYSHTERGALYKFSWVFPKKETLTGTMGFSDENSNEKTDSFAHLNIENVDLCIESEQRDHPLLLLSVNERAILFKKLGVIGSLNDKKTVPEILKTGGLSHKNRQIFDALLFSYHGDLAKVFRHIRVERFYFSRRYKRGVSVVEPQMSVDASIRQITSDQTVMSLPGSLRHLSLFEIFGPLVDGNRGLIEYSDLLKRPIDAWKYLLVACEQAQVSVGSLALFFDLILMATSNELHLGSFKEYPDWQSFKGRLELIRVPYLLNYKDEEGIYQNQLSKPLSNVHIAPHSIALAARWAVLTRLEPPSIQKYPEDLQEIIRDLTPEEKLELYNLGTAPSHLSQLQARDLKAQISLLASEYDHETNYEGRYGASPREIRTVILHAAQDRRFDHLSVQAVFEQIEQLINQKSSYEFLRREPLRGYRDAKSLLASVKEYYYGVLEDEVRSAVGLYSRESYMELFNRYILHVSAWTKKERFVDPLLGRTVDADCQFMSKIETNLLAKNESADDFRRMLIGQIGAYKLENPRLEIDYKGIFSAHLARIKQSMYAEQSDSMMRILKTFMLLEDTKDAGVDEKDYQNAATLKEGLLSLGYSATSAKCAVAFLVKEGFAGQRKVVGVDQQKLNLG